MAAPLRSPRDSARSESPLGSHVPSLDGLRAFAVILVMLFHATQNYLMQGGYIGVDVFFVLSGYLITSGLLAEYQVHKKVRLDLFYARRALRLLPALLTVAVATVMLVQLRGLRSQRHSTIHALPFVALYIGNWVTSFDGHNALGLLSHTWSLALEEQYYLAWPAVALLSLKVWKRSSVLYGIAGLVAVIWASRPLMVMSGVGWAHIYFSGGEHVDGLLVGSALAVATASRTESHRTTRLPLSRVLPLGALLGILLMGLTGDNAFSIEWTLYVPLTLTATVVLILYAPSSRSPVYAWLSSAPAIWIGKRSYGLYLWHIPVYMTLEAEFGNRPWLNLAVGLPIAFLVEAVCYQRVELPALRLKSRFRREPADGNSSLFAGGSNGATTRTEAAQVA